MSIFKKLLKSNPKEDANTAHFLRPTSVQTMGASLQKKFARGVQYNMKIVIRGDRNVGKTCLFERLQGQHFKEEYIPTDEIQVASIHWNYKTTDDIVKVEVWDIVDKGRKKKKLEGLKLENDIPIMKQDEDGEENTDEPILDADFLDVYKGTHGVLMMLDMTKSWTLDYVEREVPMVPYNVPILILANHRDMGHHRTVSADQVKTFIENLDRPSDAAQVRYTETSMRSAFGLKYVHRFFSLPFLQLQRETLLKQLETNARDISAIVEELESIEESEDSNYDAFRSQLLINRDRKAASAATSPTSPSALSSPSSPLPGPTSQDKNRLHAPPARPIPGMEAYLRNLAAQQPQQSKPGPDAAAKPVPATDANQRPTALYRDKELSKSSPAIARDQTALSSPVFKGNVDDFVPDETGGLTSFLDDAVEATSLNPPPIRRDDSSSDEDNVNPMVAGFQEDLDSEDEKSVPVRTPVVASRHLEMSTDEGEDDEEEEAVVMPADPASRKSSGRSGVERTISSTPASVTVVSQHREMSSSGYTSASSEKPGQMNGHETRTTTSMVTRDEDSSEDEEETTRKSKTSRPTSRRKSSQPSTMEEEKEVDEEEEEKEKAATETVLPTIVLDTSDFDFLERRGSSHKVSSSFVTPTMSDDSTVTKKYSKKHRREKETDVQPSEDQEKRKTKKQKKRTTGEDEETKKPRKKASHRSQIDDDVPNGTVKKSKKKSKRKSAAVIGDSSPLEGNSDLERFLNDSNPQSTGGAYEVL